MTPGQKLIIELEQLRTRLNKSGVERTNGLYDAMGEDCVFFKKSLSMFLDKDYIDIRNLLLSINQTIDIIEGK